MAKVKLTVWGWRRQMKKVVGLKSVTETDTAVPGVAVTVAEGGHGLVVAHLRDLDHRRTVVCVRAP